jgi:hypothetical protein
MRQLALLPLIIAMLGSGCSPDMRAAAVRVEVTYSFKAGCITVHARDAAAPERETSEQVEVLAKGPSTVRFAVFRQESWGRTLEITTSARERSCTGPVVAEQVSTVELQQEGIEPLAITLSAPDVDGDGYMPTAIGGTDCADAEVSSNPGATEVCDTRDNDCDGGTDEGVLPNWYPDVDNDTFGDKAATATTGCTEPAGLTRYVQNNSDCRDSDATIFPRDSAFLETRCDEVDDDCDGAVDDGFATKGQPCSVPCGGTYICNAGRTALTCSVAPPTSYHPDADGDGAGDENVPSVVCPGATPPGGTVANGDDCDDRDPHNERGRTEACDGRDNTCDGNRDENNACTGKGWKVSTDAAVTGSRNWQTVALGTGGSRVWVAGLNGVLAVRTSAGQPFTSRDGSCNTHNWRAAWVRASDGHVFLAGDGGYLAQHNGTGCINETRVGSNNNLTGIIGFQSGSNTLLYVVDYRGRLYTWDPGNSPNERFNLFPPVFYGIHGMTSTQLLLVGGTEDTPSTGYIAEYGGTGSSAPTHTLNNLPAGYDGSLRAVWMGGQGLAYAVGDKGLMMKWNGTASWDVIAPPADAQSADFTSVVMLDANSIYVTDTEGRVHLRTAARWLAPPLHDADRALRDIAAASPSEVWAVGDNGLVVHFAE